MPPLRAPGSTEKISKAALPWISHATAAEAAVAAVATLKPPPCCRTWPRRTADSMARAAFLCAFVSLWFPIASAHAADKNVWDGVFTSDQASRGKSAFEMSCARCHNLALIGSERGPAIKGSAFLAHWDKGGLSDLFIKIRDTMPEGGSG